MAENWVLVAGWPGYEVSDHGRVRNVATGHIFAQNRNSKGYVTVSFFQRKPLRPKSFKVHRLVAQAFIPNPDGLPQINHKDFDRANNHASNLEWVTGKQNVAHSVEAGRQFAHSNPKKIRALSGEDVAATRTTIERILRDADDASGQTCRGWTIEVSDGVIVLRDFNALPFITFGVADVSALFGDLRLAIRAASEQRPNEEVAPSHNAGEGQ